MLKKNRGIWVIAVVIFLVVMAGRGLSVFNLTKRTGGTIEVAAVDVGIIAGGSSMICGLIFPLLIVYFYSYIFSYKNNYQHIVRYEDRRKPAYKSIEMVMLASMLLVAAGILVAAAAGFAVSGVWYNWNSTKSMFYDELMVTNVGISHIPGVPVLVLKELLIGGLNCFFRSMLGVLAVLVLSRGWLAIGIVFFDYFLIPFRFERFFEIIYKPENGNYFGELVVNDVYLSIVVQLLICGTLVSIVAILWSARKDYLL